MYDGAADVSVIIFGMQFKFRSKSDCTPIAPKIYPSVWLLKGDQKIVVFLLEL